MKILFSNKLFCKSLIISIRTASKYIIFGLSKYVYYILSGQDSFALINKQTNNTILYTRQDFRPKAGDTLDGTGWIHTHSHTTDI